MYSYRNVRTRIKKIFMLVILIIVVSASSILIYSMYTNIDINQYKINPENNIATRIAGEEKVNEDEISDILKNVTKSVVGISKIKNTGASILETDGTKNLGLGTGVVVSDNGYIVTNWHVAGDKYSSCYVTLENGQIYSGNIVWADSNLDLAIVKIDAKGIDYLVFGDSDLSSVGETVYAIGNPIGVELQRTVTSGIISGLNRTVKVEEDSYMEDLIQTDASINSGNSGGPLINTKGQIIGINSIKIETAEGIGFAIPINIIKPIIEEYTSNGNFEEAYLGIFAYDTEVTKYLKANIYFENGIYVAQISSDGPAYKTSLKVGDIITQIDGYEINKMSELRRYIYTKKPKDTVNLTINRNSKEYEIAIQLGEK